jgi:hypothetical protein
MIEAMIEIKIIFGQSAAAEYRESKTISDEDGELVTRSFVTQAEADAYLLGLCDSTGWYDWEEVRD